MDKRGWLSKADAARELGITERSVDRHVKRGALTKAYRQRPGNTTITVFDPASVQALKAKLQSELDDQLSRMSVAVVRGDEPDSVPVAVDTRPSALEPFIAALRALPRQWALYLSWTDARHYTGLSETCLRAAVAEGIVATRAYGRGVRLRRGDLDRL